MGQYALEVGEYSLFGDDQTLTDRCTIMVLWKNEGGAWKMHRDTWNSSLPHQRHRPAASPNGGAPIIQSGRVTLRWRSANYRYVQLG